MKYTVLTIQNGIETVHIETDDYKAAQKVYLHLKACNKGRVRLNGGGDTAHLQGGRYHAPQNGGRQTMDHFKVYHRYMVILEPLDDAARGRLLTACLAYSETGELPDLPGEERFAFCSIRADIDAGRTKKAKRADRAERFVPPTVPEVEAYCAEHGYAINAQRFVDYYTSNGWKINGKTPMVDWRAAVRSWAGRDKDKEKAKRSRPAKAHNHHQRTYTETELAKIGVDLLAE